MSAALFADPSTVPATTPILPLQLAARSALAMLVPVPMPMPLQEPLHKQLQRPNYVPLLALASTQAKDGPNDISNLMLMLQLAGMPEKQN